MIYFLTHSLTRRTNNGGDTFLTKLFPPPRLPLLVPFLFWKMEHDQWKKISLAIAILLLESISREINKRKINLVQRRIKNIIF